MNVVDILIILFILFGAAIGFSKGFTRQLVDTVGTIAIIVLSFMFKGVVSGILYKFMPFFNFSNKFAGITSMNILLYEVIAFVLVFVVLHTVLTILKKTTKWFEKMLNATIILGIPSKILGAVVGLVNNFIFTFIALYFLSLPVFGLDIVSNSTLSNKILNSTPILSNLCDSTLKTFNKLDELMEQYQINPDRIELNQQTIELLIESNVIDKDTVNELIESGKLTNAKIVK